MKKLQLLIICTIFLLFSALSVTALSQAIILNRPLSGYNTSAINIDFNFTVINSSDTLSTCNLTINNIVNISNIIATNGTPQINTTNNFNDGLYHWNVTCWNSSNNVNNSVTRAFIVDTIAPTTSLNEISTSSINAGQTVYIWANWADATTGVKNVELIMSGIVNKTNTIGLAAGSEATYNFSYVTSTSQIGNTLNFTINATDYAGNENSTSLLQVAVVDGLPPNLIIVSPIDGHNSSNTNVTLQLNVTDNYASTVYCNITVDGFVNTTQNDTSITSNAFKTFTTLITGLSDSTHYWNATCWDSSNNKNTSTTRKFSVDTAPPIITNLRNTSTTNESSYIEFDCNEKCNYSISWYSSELTDFLSNSTFITSHRVYLSNLTNSTTYFVNLTVWGVVGNKAVNNTFNFTTKDIIVDTTKILNVTIISPGNNSIIFESPIALKLLTKDSASCKYNLDSGIFQSLPTTLDVEGDAWKVGTATKKLELSEDGTNSDNIENLRNITTYIDKSNLMALASSTVTNNKVTSPFNQYLYLLGPGAETALDTGYVIYNENDEDVTADFLYFKSGREIGRYLLEFITAFDSGIYDSSGSPSTSGLFLNDYKNAELKMLGKKYTIVYARRTSTVGSGIVLTLLSGAVKDTLLEKQTRNYTVNSKNYELTLNFVDSDEAQFIVNGQTTRKLMEGDTDKLVDGTIIGVTDILYQDYAGGIHTSTFFLGANKLELKDTYIKDVVSTNDLKVDDNTIDDAHVIIEGSDDNSTFRINRIHVNMTADDNFFVAAGGKLSDSIKQAGGSAAEPQVLFTENWDIEYRGLSKETTENVKIITSGSSQYNLEFLDGDGNKVQLPIAKSASDSNLLFGEQAGRILNNKENRTISKDEYIILSDSTAEHKRGERKTYVLQYKGADKITNDNPVIKFKNLGSGATIEQIYSNNSLTNITGPNKNHLTQLATLKLGGSDFKVYAVDGIGFNDFSIAIDIDADGLIASGPTPGETMPLPITTKNGMEINVTNETNAGDTTDVIFVSFRIPDESRDGNARDSVETLLPTIMRFNITAAFGKVQLMQDITTEKNRLNFRTPNGVVNIAYAYDSYGNFYTYETPTNDPALIKIEVPAKQRVPLVYMTSNSIINYIHSISLSNLTQQKHKLKINCTDNSDNSVVHLINFEVPDSINLTYKSPVADAVNVSLDTDIAFNFGTKMDKSTLTHENIILTDLNGNRVKGALFYDSVTNETRYDPHLFLKPKTTYEVSILSNVKNLNGIRPKSKISWLFTTADMDMDNDGIPDYEDNDKDNDEIDDDVDFFKGNLSNINSNFPNISMMIDSDENISKIFNGTKKIEFFKGERRLLEFDYAFSNSTKLDLSNISILNASNSSLGGVIIRGVSLSKFGWKKTTYVEKTDNNKNGICIKDEEIDWIDNISSSCDAQNEYKIECDGSSQNGYTCTYNSTINAYRITGLSHSGVVQLDYTQPSSSGSSSGSSSSGGGSGGGGGGGGGGAAGFVCFMDWKCSDWSPCNNGLQTRQCDFVRVPQHVQETQCAEQSNSPITSQKCEVKKSAETKPIGIKETAQASTKNESKSNAITGAVVEKTAKPDYAVGIAGLLLIAIAGFFIYRKFKPAS